MSYYTDLIAYWPTVQAATPGQTTAQRIAYYNAIQVQNTPAASGWTATAAQVCNCIVLSEFSALSQPNRMEVWAMLALGFPLPGGNTSILGMLAILLPSSTAPLTYANFVALANTVAGKSPRWQIDLLNGPISLTDTTIAGLS
jgi:hypothetical protein